MPTVLWTCDRCEKTENVLTDTTPSGWKHVTALPLTGHASPNDYKADWCKTCAATYLAPLPRVQEKA